jgi:hypothetical protein
MRTFRAATATELKSEKPIAQPHSAWCPGGRTTATPLRSVPAHTRSVSASTLPAASSAASLEPTLRKTEL